MKIKEGGVMDIKKEREAFEKECRLLCYKGNMVMSNLGSFYNNEQTNWMWQMWLSSKAKAVPEGFILIKDDTKTVVAIERMVEQQVEASGMDSRRLERLDGWKIIEAAVKAQEPAND